MKITMSEVKNTLDGTNGRLDGFLGKKKISEIEETAIKTIQNRGKKD